MIPFQIGEVPTAADDQSPRSGSSGILHGKWVRDKSERQVTLAPNRR
ncbi:MAG: hypothetical protein VYD70_06245 [Planctomycetota bacterium]|nr:hypothetical protein [Planctomycetota bacterium]